MAPVTGRVTLDANPVEGAVVRLAPVGGGTCAVGITDAEGRYELKTINRKGALLGDHQVSVSKDELVIDRTVLVSRAAQRKGLLAYKLEHNLPSQYASSSTSGLTVVVESGYNEFDFELHSQ